MLNPDAPIPLYRQLAEQLEAWIHSGKLAAGAKIPSEHVLAAEHGIGRPTVRQATDFLIRRGLLERRRGSGTFVLAPRAEVDLFTLGGTVAAFEGAGLTLHTSIIEDVRRVERLGEIAGPLAGRAGFVVSRLGCVDENAVLLERMYFDAATFPGLDAQRLDQVPLSRLVETQYHRRPIGGQQTIRACALKAREATRLKVEAGRGALLIERTLDFAAAKAAIFARIVLLTDRVALAQSLSDPMAISHLPRSREEFG